MSTMPKIKKNKIGSAMTMKMTLSVVGNECAPLPFKKDVEGEGELEGNN